MYLDLKENMFSDQILAGFRSKKNPGLLEAAAKAQNQPTIPLMWLPMKQSLTCMQDDHRKVGVRVHETRSLYRREEFSLLVSTKEGRTKPTLIGEGSSIGVEAVELSGGEGEEGIRIGTGTIKVFFFRWIFFVPACRLSCVFL